MDQEGPTYFKKGCREGKPRKWGRWNLQQWWIKNSLELKKKSLQVMRHKVWRLIENI